VEQAYFSPSMRLVIKVLQLNGWMTPKEIIKETTLPPRTVKYAIKKLRERQIIQEKPNLDDLRSKLLRINMQNLPQ